MPEHIYCFVYPIGHMMYTTYYYYDGDGLIVLIEETEAMLCVDNGAVLETHSCSKQLS